MFAVFGEESDGEVGFVVAEEYECAFAEEDGLDVGYEFSLEVAAHEVDVCLVCGHVVEV